MSGHERYSAVKRDVLDCFRLRSWARAYLWHAGEFELAEAVDKLAADATRDGLNKRIGVDQVQAILANAFAEFTDV